MELLRIKTFFFKILTRNFIIPISTLNYTVIFFVMLPSAKDGFQLNSAPDQEVFYASIL